MASLTRIFGTMCNAQGIVVSQGHLNITLQQDMVSIDGTKVVPSTVTVDLAVTEGYVEVYLYATVGASPDGLAYLVEYDPDPADTTKPVPTKDGYWRNYWAVPDADSVPIGDFVSSLRGAPNDNYMPLGGTLPYVSADDLTLGNTANSGTDKRIIANQYTSSPNPKIRFNHLTLHWEATNDGINWFRIGGGAGLYVENEVPSGAINGTNKVFTTAYAYENLSVYLNGVKQELNIDYQETSGTTFTFVYPPYGVVGSIPADDVMVSYSKLE